MGSQLFPVCASIPAGQSLFWHQWEVHFGKNPWPRGDFNFCQLGGGAVEGGFHSSTKLPSPVFELACPFSASVLSTL